MADSILDSVVAVNDILQETLAQCDILVSNVTTQIRREIDNLLAQGEILEPDANFTDKIPEIDSELNSLALLSLDEYIHEAIVHFVGYAGTCIQLLSVKDSNLLFEKIPPELKEKKLLEIKRKMDVNAGSIYALTSRTKSLLRFPSILEA
jgi:hypothetical protein